ncbi:competence protein ComK [Novibacillus thermophilus]|uniref:Uncharacterized protein n=1 Tax=Novibacillus thermophilus TaxID=1471761 RepID=A0A1U9K893_9BACL|nr:competence protein ComK [Novibacillus thermophilus]AQS56223.1 hypothetical protein B0W44_11070 [Novibacillus thermophilus]
MHHAVERFLMDGSACIPRNCTDVGDQLMLLLTSGKRECIKMTVRTFLKQSVAYFGNDLAALRKIYGQVIGKRYQVPLPLTEQLTLVPFKVRKPIGRQGAHGWFVAEHIRGLKRRSKVSTTIDVDGGHDILCLQSLESCEQQLRHVMLVKNHYMALHRHSVIVREAGPSFSYPFTRLFRKEGENGSSMKGWAGVSDDPSEICRHGLTHRPLKIR